MTLQEYSCFKRCLEWYQVVPQYRRDMEKEPQAAVNTLGFEGILNAEQTRHAIHCITRSRYDADFVAGNPYVNEFLEINKTANEFVCRRHAPERFATWQLYRFADTTRNRCRMESYPLSRHGNIRYFPLCFELSHGCRVQCSFCGLAAKPFCGNFSYTDENRALWRDILRISKAAIGDIIDSSVCYFATEPMDNPDYERFMLDLHEITGGISQITTALAEKYPDRLKSWMRFLGQDKLRTQAPLRFSIRTIPQFRRIMQLYRPEETVYVEMLPNNPESIFSYSDSGRASEGDFSPNKCTRYSICCIAGLRVNMADRTIEFMEPEMPDEEFPLGYRCREKRTFQTAQDYAQALKEMLARYAIGIMPNDRTLCFNKNISFEESEGRLTFTGDRCSFSLPDTPLLRRALKAVHEGLPYNRIASDLQLNKEATESLFLDLNNLFIRGYIRLR